MNAARPWHPRGGAVALLLLGACRGADSLAERGEPIPPAQLAQVRPEWLRLGPNDQIRVGVYGRPELTSPPLGSNLPATRVEAGGKVSLPLVGLVDVSGKTIAEAHAAITAAYQPYVQDPRVDVNVVEYAARRFYLFGEVERPGAYVLDRPLNLYQALAFGQGFTPRARRSQVVLLRGPADAVRVHVFDAERPRLEGLPLVQADDILFVRRSGVGKFTDEALPVLTGLSAAFGSVATLLLIEDQLKD